MHGAGHLHDHDGRRAGKGPGKPVELLETRFGGEVVEEFGDADAGDRAEDVPAEETAGLCERRVERAVDENRRRALDWKVSSI